MALRFFRASTTYIYDKVVNDDHSANNRMVCSENLRYLSSSFPGDHCSLYSLKHPISCKRPLKAAKAALLWPPPPGFQYWLIICKEFSLPPIVLLGLCTCIRRSPGTRYRVNCKSSIRRYSVQTPIARFSTSLLLIHTLHVIPQNKYILGLHV